MPRIKKLSIGLIVAGIAIVLSPAAAYAHVVVDPATTGIGKHQIFTMSVPSEKDMPTVSLRLVLPAGLQEVAPTVKPGWQVDTKKSGTGDSAAITEIDWTGGSIPAGLRDDFSFGAQAPATPTTLRWKAYQTYQDGSVVSWDQTPAGSDDASGDKGPYSTTKVINDLSASPAAVTGSASKSNQTGPYILAIVALVLAALALARTLRPRRRKS